MYLLTALYDITSEIIKWLQKKAHIEDFYLDIFIIMLSYELRDVLVFKVGISILYNSKLRNKNK